MTTQKNSSFEKSTWQFIVLIAVLLAGWLVGKFLNIDAKTLQSSLSQLPWIWSAVLFVLLYVGLQFLAEFSKDFLKPVAAVLFGFYGSCFVIWVGEAINAAAWFYLSRRLGRGFVLKWLGEKFQNFDQRVARARWGDLFALRAIILVPYRVLDPALGLTSISFPKYFLAVLLGSPPRIMMIQAFIILIKDLLPQVSKFLSNGDFTAATQFVADYLTAHAYITGISFGYLIAVVFLLMRLKKILFAPVIPVDSK